MRGAPKARGPWHVPLLPYRLIRHCDRTVGSGKELGTGSVCLFVNNRWCNNVTVKDIKCTPKLELLVVSCRPYYLPREIPCIIFVIVYLPEGHRTPSEDIIIDTVSNLQKDKPEAAIIVLGDFNQEQFKIHGFTQYVNCNTRQDRKIDYVSVISKKHTTNVTRNSRPANMRNYTY